MISFFKFFKLGFLPSKIWFFSLLAFQSYNRYAYVEKYIQMSLDWYGIVACAFYPALPWIDKACAIKSYRNSEMEIFWCATYEKDSMSTIPLLSLCVSLSVVHWTFSSLYCALKDFPTNKKLFVNCGTITEHSGEVIEALSSKFVSEILSRHFVKKRETNTNDS